MSYLLDTGVLSASSKRHPPAAVLRWLDQHEDESFISIISLVELQFGVETAAEPAVRPILETWLADLRVRFSHAVLALNEPVLLEWKRLLAELKGRNRTISCEDSLLAATARRYDLEVVTTNVRDFAPTGVPTVSLRY